MANPPIVPGLTELPERDPSGGPMAQLAGLMSRGRQEGGSALADLREGRAALQRAAKADPRLAERIRRAIEVLEGNDHDSVRRRGSEKPPKTGPLLGDARTPV